MIENLDGFIFRRNAGQGPKVNEFLSEGKRELSVTRRDTDDIFSFKFVKGSKRKSSGLKEKISKRNKETNPVVDAIETLEEALEERMPLALSEADDLCDSVVIKELPKKRVGVEDLHNRLDASSTLNDLVKLCVEWISKKKKTTYSVNLENALRQTQGAITKREVEKEAEETGRKILWVEDESRKWNFVKSKVMDSNMIEVRKLKKVDRDFGYKAKTDEVRKEFASKADKLRFLKESAKISIAHIREQSEDLLKKIFDAVCKEKEVDTFFLLKALSRVNK